MATLLQKYSGWLLAAGLLAPAAPVGAAEIDPLLPNDAQWVLKVNARQLLDSPLVKKFALEMLQKKIADSDQARQTLESLGFDPLKDIDSVTISGPGTELTGKPKFVIIVHGRFDTTKFRAKAEAEAKDENKLRIVKEDSYTLYEVAPPSIHGSEARGANTFYVAIVDESTITASPDKQGVIGTLEKKAGKKKAELSPELRGLLEKSAANQSVSFVLLGSVLHKLASEEAKEHVAKIEDVVGGIKLESDVKFDASIRSKDADAAKDLQQKIQQGIEQAKGFVEIGKEQMPALGVLLDVLDVLKVDTKDQNVNINGEVAADKVEKSLKKEESDKPSKEGK